MESKQLDLALSFISEQPLAAAKIIEQQSLDKSVEFITSIPVNYQELLITNLIPAYSARIMEQLENDTVDSISNALEVSALTRILRLVNPSRANDILMNLRKVKRKACELLMHYPHYSVGAWMTPEVAVVTSDMMVNDVRTYLEKAYLGEQADFIYVTDRHGKLEGRLACLDVLKANPRQLVHELMLVDPPWMSANFLLENAVQSYLWDNNDVIVIVDRERRILGLLQHSDLRAGLHYEDNKQESVLTPTTGLLTSLLAVYGYSLLEFFNTIFDLAETDFRP